jgi:CHAD domain-containing protein
VYQAGLSLCIREDGDRVEGSLAPVGRDGGVSLAPSTALLKSPRPDFLADSPGLLGERVRALVGSRPLRRRFELRSQGETLAVKKGGVPLGTVRIVDTEVPLEGSDRPVRMARVEVRPAAAGESDPTFRRLVEGMETRCGLRPAEGGRFEAAMIAAGETPPEPPDLGPTEIADHLNVGEAALANLRRQLLRCRRNEPGTRLGEDPEALHDMRVAVRRMRAALRLYDRYLPEEVRVLGPELKWLGGVLGEVRDLDVQLELLAGWIRSFPGPDAPALEGIADHLHDRRRPARKRLLDALDSPRYEALTTALADALREGALTIPAGARVPIVAAAPALIASRAKRVAKQGAKIKRGSPPERYHALRIACKRMRYALEFHAPLYGAAGRRVVRRLVRLQDLLGEHQDACVALGWIGRLVAEGSERLPDRASFVLGRLAERYERRAETLRAEFPRAFERLFDRRWKLLRGEIAARAAAAPRTRPSALGDD